MPKRPAPGADAGAAKRGRPDACPALPPVGPVDAVLAAAYVRSGAVRAADDWAVLSKRIQLSSDSPRALDYLLCYASQHIGELGFDSATPCEGFPDEDDAGHFSPRLQQKRILHVITSLSDPAVIAKYIAGYLEMVTSVTASGPGGRQQRRATDGLELHTVARLFNHLHMSDGRESVRVFVKMIERCVVDPGSASLPYIFYPPFSSHRARPPSRMHRNEVSELCRNIAEHTDFFCTADPADLSLALTARHVPVRYLLLSVMHGQSRAGAASSSGGAAAAHQGAKPQQSAVDAVAAANAAAATAVAAAKSAKQQSELAQRHARQLEAHAAQLHALTEKVDKTAETAGADHRRAQAVERKVSALVQTHGEMQFGLDRLGAAAAKQHKQLAAAQAQLSNRFDRMSDVTSSMLEAVKKRTEEAERAMAAMQERYDLIDRDFAERTSQVGRRIDTLEQGASLPPQGVADRRQHPFVAHSVDTLASVSKLTTEDLAGLDKDGPQLVLRLTNTEFTLSGVTVWCSSLEAALSELSRAAASRIKGVEHRCVQMERAMRKMPMPWLSQ